MKKEMIRACLGILVLCASVFCAAGAETNEVTAEQWQGFFPFGKSLQAVQGMKPQERAYSIVDADGKVMGWVFRTDQVDPQVRGQMAQVPVLVGLSTEGRVMGIQVLPNKETPAYFQKLGESFTKQFENHAADNTLSKLDAVTGATRSSSAIIKDVAAAVKAVMQLQSVQKELKPPADAPASKVK